MEVPGWISFIVAWFILSFGYLMLIVYIETRIYEAKNKTLEIELTNFRVRDIIILLLVLPLTLLGLIMYAIMWFFFEILHFEDLIYNIKDFLNKPIFNNRKDD